jgi:hypothetical protein
MTLLCHFAFLFLLFYFPKRCYLFGVWHLEFEVYSLSSSYYAMTNPDMGAPVRNR